MTALIALVRKDLILFLSDRRRLLISLVMPVVIGAFFGYLMGGSASKGTIDVALVQQDTGEIGAKIEKGLRADATLHLTAMSLAEAQLAVTKGKQSAAIVIPAGFGDAAGEALFGVREKPQIRLLYDPSQTAVLAMVKGMLTQQVMQVVSSEMFSGRRGAELADRGLRELDKQDGEQAQVLRELLGSVKKYQVAQQDSAKAQPAGLSMPFTTSDEQMKSGPAAVGYNGYAHSFAGMAVQFILFMGIDMGIGVLLAKRDGVWNRVLAAPVSLTTVLLARAVSTAVIAFGLLCAVFVIAVAGFGVHIASVAGFLCVALGFAAMTAGFGLLIAAFGKTPEAARGIAMIATLLMVMAGGAWMPSFLFPPWMQKVSLSMPTRWAVDGLDGVTWRGFGMEVAGPAMAVLFGFALVFAALAVFKFRRDAE
ncbi:linearmycin resistance permease LnrM [Massilia terrae]|uniref:ABC transporter permease n=1 Tax=Massilia terrae TaxID=1811224 RepID=A0ABT2D3Q0_9BURK|nr:ABC transporter permease [Massilia terrae]MCS0660869.1 ABC transporter permease [Massilia terrae]